MNERTTLRDSDRAARAAAIDPRHSFIVSAPAGSGKTALLTQRFLALLASVDEPEQCLAITFTRKAAAEMAKRITEALTEASRGVPPQSDFERATYQLARSALARSETRGWALLSSPQRLRIQTIDSFNRYLAKQLAVETGLGELPPPADNVDYDYRCVATDLLENYADRDTLSEPIATLLEHTGNNQQSATELLVRLLAIREQWLLGVHQHDAVTADGTAQARRLLEQLVSQALARTRHLLLPFLGQLLEHADRAAANLPDKKHDSAINTLRGITELPAVPAALPVWRGVAELLLTNQNQWRKTVTVNEGFPAGSSANKAIKAEFLALLGELASDPLLAELTAIKTLPDPQLVDHQRGIIAATMALLPFLTALLDLHFSTHNRCDFTSYALAARRALAGPEASGVVSDVALRLDYQLKHILVDEFQDTSKLQYELLAALTGHWQPGDGRTLFLVGDAMQSLYSFRNANVGLFITAQRHPIGGAHCQPLQLASNFRSQSGVIDWVNTTFPKLFPSVSDASSGAVSYTPSLAEVAAGSDPAVELTLCTDHDLRHAKQLEGRAVAERVVALRDLGNRDGKPPSIALLVRSRAALAPILPEFKRLGVSWRAVDIEPLAETMVVTDLVTITRALSSSADRIAWLGLLRSPMVGLTLADLWQLAGDRQQQTPLLSQLEQGDWPQLSSDGQQRLARCAPAIVDHWQQRGRVRLDRRVESLWRTLNGPATLSSGEELGSAEVYFEQLSRHLDQQPQLDWQQLQPTIDKLYAKPASGAADVEVMTIHKSKGLEFDHVLLPALGASGGSDGSDLLVWLEELDDNNQATHILAAKPAWDASSDPLYQFIKARRSEKQRHEATRVFYVAATRAAEQLHLFASGTIRQTASGDGDITTQLKPPSNSSPLALLWPLSEPIVAALVDAGGGSQLVEGVRYSVRCSAESTSASEPTAPSAPHWHRLPIAHLATASAATNRLNTAAPLDGFDLHNALQRQLGTEVHRVLERLSATASEHRAALIDSTCQQWQRRLQQSIDDWERAALQRLIAAAQQWTSCQRLAWLLSDHPEAASELALNYRDSSGRLRSAVVDRTFVIDGERWIVDYKSAAPLPGESVEIFYRRQSAEHGDQLARYGELLTQLDGRPQRRAIYFALLGGWHELTASRG